MTKIKFNPIVKVFVFDTNPHTPKKISTKKKIIKFIKDKFININ